MKPVLALIAAVLLAGCIVKSDNNAEESGRGHLDVRPDFPEQGPNDRNWYFRSRPTRPDHIPAPPVPPGVELEPEPASTEAAFALVAKQPEYHRLRYRVWSRLGDDPAKFLELLDQSWAQPDADRRLLARVFVTALAHSMGRNAKPGVSKTEALLKVFTTRVLELDPVFEEAILIADTSGKALRKSPSCRALLKARIPAAPKELRPAWGAWLLADSSDYLSTDEWVCVAAAWEHAVALEEAGESDIRPVLWFGGGAENYTVNLRADIAWHIQENPSPSGAALLARMIEADPREDVLGSCLRALDGLQSHWPETTAALRAALLRDHAWLNVHAAGLVAKMELDDASLKGPLRELAAHWRPDVRRAAQAALPGRPPPQPKFRIASDSLLRLRDIAPFALAGGRRVQAYAQVRSCWGGVAWAEKPVPGWLFEEPGRVRFISDELDVCDASLAEVRPKAIDFDAEVAAMPKRWIEDDRRWRPGFDTWVVGHPFHSFLRLLFVAQLDTESDDRLSSLYLELVQQFPSEQSMLEWMVYELVWLQYSQCVNAFITSADDIALLHAKGLQRYAKWSRPQTDFENWLDHARMIESDIKARREQIPAADEDTVEYWVARLPDIVIRQMSQPGDAAISPESNVADRIVDFGLEAVWPLVRELDRHDRLVRGCGFWRDFSRDRSLYTTGNIAAWLLTQIFAERLGVEPADELFWPEHRNLLRGWLEEAIAAAQRG